MVKSSTLKVKTAILSLAFLAQGFLAISCAMSDIAKSFPDASESFIQSIINIPTLLSIPFLLVGGFIAGKINKKLLVVIGLILFTLGGTAPFFLNNAVTILATRCLFGIGFGIIILFAQSLIADFFMGTEDYQPMLGYQSATVAVGSIIMNLIAGVLSTTGWHHVFLVYLAGLIPLAIVCMWLPGQQKQVQSGKKRTPSKVKVPAVVLWYVAGIFMYGFFMIPGITNISFLISDNNLGSTFVSGIVVTLYTVGGILGGLFFGHWSRILKRKSTACALFLHAAGMLIMSTAVNLPVVAAGTVIAGFAFSSVMPSIMAAVGKESREASTMGFALANVGVNAGNFLSGIFMPLFLQNVCGTKGSGQPQLICGGTGLLVSAVVCMFFSMKAKKEL
jgi:MFS family permease